MNTSQVVMRQIRVRRGLVFGVIIVTALFAFEVFNYSTTEFALSDLLGELEFASIRWATILAIAFCGIDFAGIARLFTPTLDPGSSDSNPNESWYLFGAWLLAATMNAMLTWWGISLAILGHQTLGNDVVSRATLLRIVPIFVSVLVWLIRVLIIGTFSVAGDRLFNPDAVAVEEPRVVKHTRPQPQPRSFPDPAPTRAPALRPANSSSVMRSAGKAAASNNQPEMFPSNRAEPTYHSISASSGNAVRGNSGGAPTPPSPRPGAPRPGSQGSQYRNNGR
jgi:hypothetical protein